MNSIKAVFLLAFCALLLHMLPVFASADPSLACCIPTVGFTECISYNQNGGTFGSYSDFKTTCDNLPGDTQDGVTCNGLSGCKVDCCCATSDVEGDINSDEGKLLMTQNACSLKNTADNHYRFLSRNLNDQSLDTCVEVCGGTEQVNDNTTWSVSGRAYNTSASPAVPMAGIKVFIPVPEGTISNFTDSRGAFIITGVPQITTNIYGYSDCGASQSEPVVVNKDVTGVVINFDCGLHVCTHSTPSISAPTQYAGGSNISFKINYEDTCKDFSTFLIYRNSNLMSIQNSTVFADSAITNNTQYCYSVAVQNSDGTVTNMSSADAKSSANCVTTGDYDCMHLSSSSSSSWCGQDPKNLGMSAKISCDSNNKKSISDCLNNTVCGVSGSKISCVPAADCNKCNGILGYFASLNLTVPIGDGSVLLTSECSNLKTTCYISAEDFNSKPVMIDLYDSCKYVTGCTSYTTESICNTNPCRTGAGGACSWKNISKELGSGICVTKSNPECSACNTLGFCNKAACTAISSDCYFDGNDSFVVARGCINKKEMACAYYDTKDDCIGSGNDARFDITYDDPVYDDYGDATYTRIGGTNSRTPSNDLMGLGSCSWIEDRNYCVKNADNLFITSPSQDDCVEHGVLSNLAVCMQDNTPPNTTLLFSGNYSSSNPPVYSRAAINVLPFSAIDDKWPSDEIHTYVCLSAVGGYCYPNSELGVISIPNAGTYDLYYYSMDGSYNSEQVKSARIAFVDNHEASLINLTISENN